MRNFLKFSCLLAFFFVFNGCATRTPSLITFAAGEGLIQYFFPMMEWKGDKKKEIGAVCDITYRHQSGSQGVYNISFLSAGPDKGKVPSVPAAISLEGDGTAYPLSSIERLFANTETGTTRITSQVEGEDLLSFLRSQSLTLIAVIDGAEYRFTPPKQFLEYRDKFLADIAAQDSR